MATLPTGHFANYTVCLPFGRFAYWTLCLLVIWPTRHLAYGTFHLPVLDSSLLFGHFAYEAVHQIEGGILTTQTCLRFPTESRKP